MATRSGSTSSSRTPTKAGPVELTPEHRVVLLKGSERFLMGLLTDQLIEKLRAEHENIETIRFDGAEDEPVDILDECRSFGLLSTHKAIVVRNADEFVTGDRRAIVERYAQNPSEAATLILQSEKWRPGKLDKLIASVGAIKDCKQVNEMQAVKWAIQRANVRHASELEPGASQELVARTGPDLGKIDSELGKLAASAGTDRPITRGLVAEMVELSREQAVWLIQGALASGNAQHALHKLHELMDTSGIDIVPLRYFYADVARKVHQYARARESGMSGNIAMRQAKMFGDGVPQMTALADAIGSAGATDLLKEAVRADVRGKTGQGNPVRGLEMLTIRFSEARAHTSR